MITVALAFLMMGSPSWASPRPDGDEVAPPPPPAPLKPKDETQAFGSDLEVQIHYELVFNKSRDEEVGTCGWKCNGLVHKTHEECDHSCDQPCTAKHEKVLEVLSYCVPPDSYYTDFGKGLQRIGSALGSEWAEKKLAPDLEPGVNAWLAPVLKSPKYNQKLTFPHWCDDPCSYSTRTVKQYFWTIMATYQAVRFDIGPDGTKIPVKGSPTKMSVGELIYSDPDTLVTGKPYVACRCKIVMTEDETRYWKMVDEIEKWKARRKEEEKKKTPEKPKDPPAGVKNTQTGMLLGPTDLQKCTFAVVCQDMNEAVCTATNPYSKPIDFCIDPGTLCVPENSSCQTMTFCSQCNFTVAGKSTVQIPLGIVPLHGPAVGSAPGEGRADIACLEMHKHAPNPSERYTIDVPADLNITALAQVVNHESFRGSWDQARFWIYTDKCNYDELSKRLIPSPAEGTFLRLLYDVYTVARVDFADPEYRRCISPDLLAGKGSAPTQAVQWFVQLCAKLDPSGLAASVRSHREAFQALSAEGASEGTILRLADIGKALTESDSPEVRSSGLDFLTNAVPEARRGEVMKRGGLSGVLELLASGDTERCAAALAVVELYGCAPAYPFVKQFAAATADAGLRDKAQALCKKLVPIGG